MWHVKIPRGFPIARIHCRLGYNPFTVQATHQLTILHSVSQCLYSLCVSRCLYTLCVSCAIVASRVVVKVKIMAEASRIDYTYTFTYHIHIHVCAHALSTLCNANTQHYL